MKHASRNIPLTALSLATAALIAACGGGGSASPGPTTISGAVIDGYITGATVCLDLNRNNVCDASEPSAVTTTNGAYSFVVPAGTDLSSRSTMHLVVTVPSTARDSDAPTAAIVPYKMLAPADMPTVISPLTTAVSARMIANGESLANARIGARTDLNLPVAYDFAKDYVATNDAAAHNVAKVVAAYLAVTIGTAAPTSTNLNAALTLAKAAALAAYGSSDVSATVSGILGSPTPSPSPSPTPTPTPTPTPSGSGATGTCTTNSSQTCLSFSESTMAFEAFEGLVSAAIANDPADSGNLVAMYVKGATGQPWAGATLFTNASNKSVPRVGLNTSKTVTLRVYSPAVGENIRLKLEDAADGTHTIEVDAVTTVANAWQTLTFDFTTPASGTAAYNSTYTYNKVSIFPKFLGTVTTNKTYYFDELKYAAYAASPAPTPSATPLVYASNYSQLTPDTWRSTQNGDAGTYSDSGNTQYWWNGVATGDATPSFYFGYGANIASKPWGFGAFVKAPANGTASVGSHVNLKFAVWGNDELTSTRPTFTVILKGPTVASCASELKSTVVVPAVGVQNYTLPFSGFTLQTPCGYANVAAALAAGVNEIHIQVLGANLQYTAAGAAGFFPNGLNVGPMSFD